jgi:hypothetical protein
LHQLGNAFCFRLDKAIESGASHGHRRCANVVQFGFEQAIVLKQLKQDFLSVFNTPFKQLSHKVWQHGINEIGLLNDLSNLFEHTSHSIFNFFYKYFSKILSNKLSFVRIVNHFKQ